MPSPGFKEHVGREGDGKVGPAVRAEPRRLTRGRAARPRSRLERKSRTYAFADQGGGTRAGTFVVEHEFEPRVPGIVASARIVTAGEP